MAAFTVTRDVAAPADDVWRLVTDWPAHARWAPLTRVTVTHPTGGLGTRFVGRTGIGPFAVDDPMEVVRWQPPAGDDAGRCTLRKHGRVVLGWAEIEVVPRPGGRSRVVWTEDVDIAPVTWTGWAAPLLRGAGRLGFALVLRRMAGELARSRVPGGDARG